MHISYYVMEFEFYNVWRYNYIYEIQAYDASSWNSKLYLGSYGMLIFGYII